MDAACSSVGAIHVGTAENIISDDATCPAPSTPYPTIETGVTAMTLAVLSVFDQRARGQ
jgi:hypothetical protein